MELDGTACGSSAKRAPGGEPYPRRLGLEKPHLKGPSGEKRPVRRRGRDSNPREASTAPTRLAGGRTRPLCDPPKPGTPAREYSELEGLRRRPQPSPGESRRDRRRRQRAHHSQATVAPLTSTIDVEEAALVGRLVGRDAAACAIIRSNCWAW